MLAQFREPVLYFGVGGARHHGFEPSQEEGLFPFLPIFISASRFPMSPRVLDSLTQARGLEDTPHLDEARVMLGWGKASRRFQFIEHTSTHSLSAGLISLGRKAEVLSTVQEPLLPLGLSSMPCFGHATPPTMSPDFLSIPGMFPLQDLCMHCPHF